MISIDHSSVRMPRVLGESPESPAAIERQAAAAFYHSGKNSQSRFTFKSYRHPEVRAALSELFHRKCAYCESRLEMMAPADIEHYRPKSPVVESEDHPGYWWLANSWDNLLLTCQDCNRPRKHGESIHGKGNRFPLQNEKKRAYSEGEEVQESPLLLNPCIDPVEKYLVFDVDGTVSSAERRGQATIELLGLNRPGLVAERQSAATRLVFLLKTAKYELSRMASSDGLGDRHFNAIAEQIRQHISDEHVYAGMARQIVGRFSREIDLSRILDTNMRMRLGYVSKDAVEAAKKSYKEYHAQSSVYNLDTKKGREIYRSKKRLVEHISISNVKSIRRLDLDLRGATEGGTAWLMLLGENGTGKSTVLHSLAIALMGPEYFADLVSSHDINPSDLIRYRCKSARIRVKVTGFDRPHEVVVSDAEVRFMSPSGNVSTVKVSRGRPQIQGAQWDANLMLLAYGATRLLPRTPGATRSREFLRVGNLFNPFVPLADANSVLVKASKSNFDAMALVLKDLLDLPEDAEFSCVDKEVIVVLHGSKVSLKHLSDGYQSVIALALDILEVGQRLWKTLSNAEGIVLLDEVGTHLHPTWKMRIVGSLRRALPGIQFISTTHDPLCLRGLVQNEVVVLKRNLDRQVIAVADLPSPADFRIDQLLTSEFFGLNSTFDEEVESAFDQYYALLAKGKRTAPESELLEELTMKLKDRRYFGGTLREQLMYHAIDQLIADGTLNQQLPRAKLNQEAVKQISALWNRNVAAAKEEAS